MIPARRLSFSLIALVSYLHDGCVMQHAVQHSGSNASATKDVIADSSTHTRAVTMAGAVT